MPYNSAIKRLRKLTNMNSPIDKMRCITQTSSKMVKCIDAFWEGMNNRDKWEKVLDADQILMIFIYVIIKANVKDLFAHLKVINEFSTPSIR